MKSWVCSYAVVLLSMGYSGLSKRHEPQLLVPLCMAEALVQLPRRVMHIGFDQCEPTYKTSTMSWSDAVVSWNRNGKHLDVLPLVTDRRPS